MNTTSDLTILGGGLAGLSLALQCRQQLPNASITVLEKRQHPVPEAAHKVGESTVEVGAHYFGHVLGLRQHILDKQLPKLGLRFFFPAGDNSCIEDRLELGGRRYAPCPSYQLDRGRFENFLADRCLEEDIRFIDLATIKDVNIARFGRRHQVTYEVNGQQQALASRWVVDASGRRAFLKRKLNLEKPSPHIGNAAWFRFSEHIRIDEWSNDDSWQQGYGGRIARWYSTNHLMGKGYWVWMIPLASGSTSMGIVAAEECHSLSDFNSMEKAVTWLEKYEPQCADAVKKNLDKVQDFRAIKHYATECQQVFSRNRWGITGEAGFFHDPFYSPGSDFIAFSNTFLTDLVSRDLTGRDFRIRAYTYNRIYKRFYYGTKTVYQGQYPIFGNPIVMPTKILWDYLVYWYITGFFFMHNRMCHQTMYLRNLSRLSQFEKVNHFMQEFFLKWHHATDGQDLRGTIDISGIPLVRESNRRLLEELDNRGFIRQFTSNLEQLQTLACEIVEQSGLAVAVPFQRSSLQSVEKDAFKGVYYPTTAVPMPPQSSAATVAAEGP
jgi:flavin-dependent dehydrogenase